MPDHDAFLRTILDRPDENGPRLVYADWLEEHGDTRRAELIRVQIQMVRIPDRYGKHWHQLKSRQDVLLKSHK